MARYKDAIWWLVANDDVTFLDQVEDRKFLSVTALLVADLFNKSDKQVVEDLIKEKRAQQGFKNDHKK